jgi:hypothetical protein
MDCKSCGVSITGKEEFCRNCGVPTVQSMPNSNGPRGVGGWLLLLCVLLTVVLPANVLYGTVRSLAYRPDGVVLVINAANIGVALLSLMAGIMLWRVQKNAVKVTKIFLGLNPLHALGVFCLIATSNHLIFPRLLVSLALRILTVPLLISLAWYWYLLASQRVRNTYGMVS